MLDFAGTGRPAEALLSRTIRFSIGGTEYTLPVRSIKANREWKETVNAGTAGILSGLEASGDNIAALLNVLSNQIDPLLDALLSYDQTGVLPSREEIEAIEPDCSLEIVAAVQEVWRAANPLVATAVEQAKTGEAMTNGSSRPTSSPRPSTAGRPRRSKRH